MAQPVKPPNLDSSLTYIHITSPSTPDKIATQLKSDNGPQINYVGPVGELSGEHIFQVVKPDGPVKRDDTEWISRQEGFLSSIKGIPGVQGVKILEMKQRAKRGGEL